MHDKLFEAALGIARPWYVVGVDFDEKTRVLSVRIDFESGTRFAAEGAAGEHPVHDTVTKTFRHLNFFQHECHLLVRTPRVKLPDGSVELVKPPFAGRLSGFTLLFEAMILILSQQMPFAAVARIVGESAYRVLAVCRRYVALGLEAADFSEVTALTIDETPARSNPRTARSRAGTARSNARIARLRCPPLFTFQQAALMPLSVADRHAR